MQRGEMCTDLLIPGWVSVTHAHLPCVGSVSLCSGVPALLQVKNSKPNLFWTNRIRLLKRTYCLFAYKNIPWAESFTDLLLLRIIDMYVRCHHVNQTGQLDSSDDGRCVCVWVCVSESLSAAPEWMVRIRDSHAKGQSGRKRQQSCLKRALFLITTSNVPLCTSFPPRPPGISESSMMMMRTMMMIMMSPDGQTPPASPTSLYSSQTLNRNLTEKLCTFFFVTIKSFIINKF